MSWEPDNPGVVWQDNCQGDSGVWSRLGRNGTLYPVEIKKSASPRRSWLPAFAALRRLDMPVGEGAIVCLCDQPVPLDDHVNAVPVGLV